MLAFASNTKFSFQNLFAVSLVLVSFFYNCSDGKNPSIVNEDDLGDKLLKNGSLKTHPDIPDLLIDENMVNMKEEWMVPLTHPIWKKGQLAFHMKDDDVVIGIIHNDQSYALPWWIFNNYSIANIELSDEPIVICLCVMCSSAEAYNRNVNGQALNFSLEGFYKSAWFMKDKETGSYWLPFSGESFYGALKDSLLKPINTYQTTWGVWRAEHEDTKVLYDSQEKRKGHGEEEFPGRPHVENFFEFTLAKNIPTTIPKYDMVLGIGKNDIFKAYSNKTLDKIGQVIQDTLSDGSPVVIFHKVGTILSGAFYPNIDGQNLSFSVTSGNKIIDNETKSYWSLTGKCIAGTLKDKELNSYFFITKEWYAWYTYHPETEVFSEEE